MWFVQTKSKKTRFACHLIIQLQIARATDKTNEVVANRFCKQWWEVFEEYLCIPFPLSKMVKVVDLVLLRTHLLFLDTNRLSLSTSIVAHFGCVFSTFGTARMSFLCANSNFQNTFWALNLVLLLLVGFAILSDLKTPEKNAVFGFTLYDWMRWKRLEKIYTFTSLRKSLTVDLSFLSVFFLLAA